MCSMRSASEITSEPVGTCSLLCGNAYSVNVLLRLFALNTGIGDEILMLPPLDYEIVTVEEVAYIVRKSHANYVLHL